ncbi:MAG: hypothetical protein R8P61_33015 [Bacteroidia bacterium]|nr:hypothetical protein [Bacteroidia bacterium]
MKYYQLSSKTHPELNFYGSLKEIYEFVERSGYKGKTEVIHGYPLPAEGDIAIEESYMKKPNTLRLSHEVWHVFDKIVQQKEGFNNRVDAISYLVQLYEQMDGFGPLQVKTSEGLKEYRSLKEFIELRPFFEDQGYDKGFSIEFQ